MTTAELSILDWIQQNLRCGFLDAVMPYITKLGDAGIFWIITAVVLLIIKRTRPLGFAMAIALVFDVILCNGILKPLIARTRPYDINTAVQLIVARPTDYSFPSGHTAASFAAASSLWFSKSKLWIPATVLAVLIAFSRLYLYVHFPTDVLGGVFIGVLCGLAGCIAARKLTAAYEKRKLSKE